MLSNLKFCIQFGTQFENATIDTSWTSYDLDIIPGAGKVRVIIFKTQESKEKIGFLTVKDKEDKNKVIWDLSEAKGAHTGLVPELCPCEAMYVDVKFITPR
jgi:hypothetical protein